MTGVPCSRVTSTGPYQPSKTAPMRKPKAAYHPVSAIRKAVPKKTTTPTAAIVVYCAGGVRSAFAARTLAELGYENVHVRCGDGYGGWPDKAPFDAIVVTAAPDHVPQPLVQQLKIGGHLIIPVGPVGGVQTLWRVTRTGEKEVQSENLGSVRFVPLTREEREE